MVDQRWAIDIVASATVPTTPLRGVVLGRFLAMELQPLVMLESWCMLVYVLRLKRRQNLRDFRGSQVR